MEVWVKQWTYPSDNEFNITLFSSEIDALRSTCDEIEDSITNDWDMDDEGQALYADEISDFIQKKQYRDAVLKWNDYQDNFNSDYGHWWNIYQQEVLGGDEISCTPTQPAPAFKASYSGATCRGPCNQFNDYAYADRPDGTHLCRQCSTFQHIFGTKQ